MIAVKLHLAADAQKIGDMLWNSFSQKNTTVKHYGKEFLFPKVQGFSFSKKCCQNRKIKVD